MHSSFSFLGNEKHASGVYLLLPCSTWWRVGSIFWWWEKVKSRP